MKRLKAEMGYQRTAERVIGWEGRKLKEWENEIWTWKNFKIGVK